MACRLLLAVWLVLAMWTGLTGSVCKLAWNSGVGNEKNIMIFAYTALAPCRQQHANLSTPRTVTMRSIFAHDIVYCTAESDSSGDFEVWYRLSKFKLHEHI